MANNNQIANGFCVHFDKFVEWWECSATSLYLSLNHSWLPMDIAAAGAQTAQQLHTSQPNTFNPISRLRQKLPVIKVRVRFGALMQFPHNFVTRADAYQRIFCTEACFQSPRTRWMFAEREIPQLFGQISQFPSRTNTDRVLENIFICSWKWELQRKRLNWSFLKALWFYKILRLRYPFVPRCHSTHVSTRIGKVGQDGGIICDKTPYTRQPNLHPRSKHQIEQRKTSGCTYLER